MTFRRGTVVLAMVTLGAGRATYQTTSLPQSATTITATFNPSGSNFASSVGSVVHVAQ